MAKSDLIGGTLWESYSHKVNDRMLNPRHLGEITEADAKTLGARLVIADWGAEVCGDAIRAFWAVEPRSNRILDARFKTFGCGTAIASSDMMCEMIIGKTVDEAMKITNIDVEHALRDEEATAAIPPQKMHCSVMAYDVIRKAAAEYKGVDMDSLEEEEIVCQCARVSLRTIRDVIRINNLTTVEEITHYTKAGAFCKSCIRPGGHESRRRYLVDILASVRAEMEREKAQAEAAAPPSFARLGLIQKHRAVEVVLDEKVRPALLKDGGNLEVVDMKVADDATEVYIRYSGACKGCPSAEVGTLSFIQEYLQKELDPGIRVLPV
ncbi:MAG TPA: iron-sulfur cluster assembly scaffold protein [Spirochaetia bacterium]|nr:iron-sulfur cluster assembly scaffold protein [Spirochaetia bacterium]